MEKIECLLPTIGKLKIADKSGRIPDTCRIMAGILFNNEPLIQESVAMPNDIAIRVENLGKIYRLLICW
ncbi:MAG: hypothetical protein EOL88_10995 [Bacteroidia bacterium]|nr:hypothetical protein [Bacteroidia bacterium]